MCPAVLCHLIIMADLTVLTTELLVNPAIFYLISTLKAYRYFPLFLRIFHKTPVDITY